MGANQYTKIFKFKSKKERKKVINLSKSAKIENRIAIRARILVLRDSGKNQTEIAALLNIDRSKVSRWESRYQENGIKGLYDRPGRGRKPSFSP